MGVAAGDTDWRYGRSGGYFRVVFRALTGVAWNDSVIAALVLLLLTGINCLGARAGSNVQSAFMLLRIAAIAGLVILGFSAWRKLAEIGTVAWTTGFVWTFEEHWICHGTRRVCVWWMADRDLCRR